MLGMAELPITILAWLVLILFCGGVIKGFLGYFFEAKEEVKKELEEREAKNRVKKFVSQVLGGKNG